MDVPCSTRQMRWLCTLHRSRRKRRNMMKGSPDKTICLKCGAPLTGDARGGFCPKCLFAQASVGDSDDQNQCEAHFHIGITCLADGDRSAAREHFKKCVAVRIFYSFESQWGRAFLARLEQNPSWPPWIPIKPEP